MKKLLVFICLFLSCFSLIVLNLLVSTDIFFNYVLFLGIVSIFEIITIFLGNMTYKVIKYYNMEQDYSSRNRSLFFILKKTLFASLFIFILFFLVSFLLSDLIIGNNSLTLILRLSSVVILLFPIIAILRGFLYSLKLVNDVCFSYLLTSFLSMLVVVLSSMFIYFLKINANTSSYILILFTIAIYFFNFLYLVNTCKNNVKLIRKNTLKISEKESDEEIKKRIIVYSYPFVFSILLILPYLDILYGKFLLKVNTPLLKLKEFDVTILIIGPLFNFIIISFLLAFVKKRRFEKNNLLNIVAKIFGFSLSLAIFISLFYNPFGIYRYFVYLLPFQVIIAILLEFLYNQNKRKIIVNSVIGFGCFKILFNIILLHFFKYTELFGYTGLITSSIICYLFVIVVFLVNIISTYKFDCENFIKDLFDIFTSLIASILIVLLFKHFIYYENIFISLLYVILGMTIYLLISKNKVSK